MTAPRRGSIWATNLGQDMLIVSSTVYNEIRSETTVLAVPVFEQEPETGFGVDIHANWALPSLIFPLRKSSLVEQRSEVGTQALTNVNSMLFKVLATPER